MSAPQGIRYSDRRRFTRQLHEKRMRASRAREDAALDKAWHDVQLHWLQAYPAYRELLRERVHEAALKAEKLSRRIDREHVDVDYLGHDFGGCG